MSKLSEIKGRIHALGDIQGILNAMRSLSMIEMNKVSRFLVQQEAVTHTVQSALADFEASFGTIELPTKEEGVLCVLIGSERGFCGPFNETLVSHLESETKNQSRFHILTVGRRISLKVDSDPRLLSARVGSISGANSVEEIPRAISALSDHLIRRPEERWLFIHNSYGESHLETEATFPLEVRLKADVPQFQYPPVLNMAPEQLLPKLLEQYLSCVMYNVFYRSFMAENRERLRHMDGALRKLDQDLAQLTLSLNASRQEEITEELELILLNTKQR